ncbi:MAG: peptide deformylase [Anaerolineae bacterium]|jgi:peptide deformylase|nr:peptide deformylase [Anaerolineae bacterium]
MALLPIIQPDNPTLRQKAVRVSSFGPELQKLIDDMVDTMTAAPGVGLAAPQVNVSQRLIVVRLSDDEESKKEHGEEAGKLYVVANPKIIKASRDLVEGVEGCLSIPGWVGTVMRHEEVVITGQDRHGKDIRIKARDWLARVFQHEIDHLDGRLYTDIAEEMWRPDERDEDGEGDPT